jgi:hypothetical protein
VIGARTWIVMALCASGCGNEIGACATSDALPEGGEGFEICNQLKATDEARYCIAADGACKTSSQCPSGLTCMTDPKDPSSPEPNTNCSCRPLGFNRLTTGASHLALQRGFSVGGMPSFVDTAEVPPRLTWQAPPGARHVACALFSCPPRFTRAGCSPTDENELFQIDNFEQCVLLFDAAPATQPGFLLSHEHAYTDPPRCNASALGPRVVIELAVGCWAYDTTSIVAATELHPIRGSLLAELPGIPHDAACPWAGADCYDATTDVFGVCLEGSCRPRCRTHADCALATDGMSGDSCRPLPEQDLSACVRQP